MGSYVPSTERQRKEMLEKLGLSSCRELYQDVPPEVLLQDGPDIPKGMSELEVKREMSSIAKKNKVYSSIYRGAGAYWHYIPAIVSSVTSREEFVTAYTPYQAEISQGVLQSIFEYQTMICELTGMDVANASVYDGATACAEAVSMCADRSNSPAYVSAGVHPEFLKVVKTYCWAHDREVRILPLKDGVTDMSSLEEGSCVLVQQVNFRGCIEDAEEIGRIVHEKGMKYILCVDPFAACLLPSASACGADVAVGEGQGLGMPLSFGGPYLGFMACRKELMRRLPGRIVGQTKDKQGRRAYVLTLQAREQHIRRERALSNICSNEALCAMTAAVYLSSMGPQGMKQAALQCVSKAHYLQKKLEGIGFRRVDSAEFFHEFVTDCPMDKKKLAGILEDRGILGPLEVEDGLLWCATEMNAKKDMDRMIEEVRHEAGL